jgi:general secretion pathway protein D
LLAFVFLSFLAACGAGPDPRLLDVGNVDLSPKAPTRVDTGRGTTASGSSKGTYQIYPGDETRPAKATVAQAGEVNVTKSEGGFQINIDNASVAEVAKLVLGDTLGQTYILDPRVQGTITISTARPLTEEEALAAFEAALQMNSAVLIKEAGHYKIVPSGDVAEGEMGSADFAAEKSTPGYGVSVVPLRYVSAASIMELLDSFITRDTTVKASASGNLILLRGTAAQRQSLVDVVLSFDVDWMKRQSASIVTLANSAPDDVVPKLEAIFASDVTAGGENAIRFVALERLNAVLLIANTQERVRRAVTWVARLDRESLEGVNYYTYVVQNGKAADLAKVLNATFQDQSTGLDTSQVSPEQQPFQKSTEPSSGQTGSTTSGQGSQDQGSQGGQGTQQPGSTNQTGKSDLSGTSTTFGEAPSETAGTETGTLGKGIRITPSLTNNTLVIRATAREYRKILAILHTIDGPGVQIMVNTTIAEVVLNDQLRYGVQAYFKSNGIKGGIFNGGGNSARDLVLRPSFPGLNLILGAAGDPRLVLDALSEVTTVRVVSSPSIVVLENQPATIKVGDQVPITVQEQQDTSSSDSPIINSIEYRDTGVILQVIPRVNSQGLVTMLLSQELSAVVPNAGGSTDATTTPTISQRSVTSTVSVYSDQTVVLGGLISGQLNYTRDTVPIVSKIPVIGDLIGDTEKTGKRSELVVFITPRVIRDSIDASIVSQELRAKMKLIR